MNGPALTAYLEQIGRADTDGVRVRARYGRCPTCRAQILTGLDAPVAGLPRVCDTTDLDRVGELRALVAGRATFTVLELPDGLRLTHRDPEAIRSGRQERPVVAAHDCTQTPPPSTVFRWRLPAAANCTDQPPF